MSLPSDTASSSWLSSALTCYSSVSVVRRTSCASGSISMYSRMAGCSRGEQRRFARTDCPLPLLA